MEDAPTTVVNMPPINEPGRGSPSSSEDISRPESRIYVPMPDSPQEMPLLQPDDSPLDGDRSGQSLLPHGRPNESSIPLRPSFETLPGTDEGHHSPEYRHPPALDPRGAAPPYFEAISLDDPDATLTDDSPSPIPPVQVSPPEPISRETSSGSTRRRSAFFNLFNSRSNANARPPVPPIPDNIPRSSVSHVRSDSGPSVMSLASTSGDGHARPRSRSTHRPSHSGSGSVFNIGSSAFRTLSRQKSNSNLHPNLTSPSMISLNSISAPLTHTLVKTEFAYPKSGPTPEQLKLISSRETFARFGMPYGADAIAYASHSRVDLSQPPPEFEEFAGPSGHARRGSNLSGVTGEDHSPAVVVTPVSEPEAIPLPESPVLQPVEPAEQLSVPPTTTQHIPAPLQLHPSSPSTSNPPLSAPSPPSAFKSPESTLNRSESRASSYLSFATAEESIHTASVPSTPVIPHLTIPNGNHDIEDEEMNGQSPSSASTTAPSTPRIPSRHIQDGTDTTITPAIPSPLPSATPPPQPDLSSSVNKRDTLRPSHVE